MFAFRDEGGLSEDTALKIACGLGAGMGRREEVCGAVTGGILAIGLKYGRGANDDRSATEAAYSKTVELMDRFSEKHGTYICRKLLKGCDITTPEGHREFQEGNYRRKYCLPCVQTVVEILETLL